MKLRIKKSNSSSKGVPDHFQLDYFNFMLLKKRNFCKSIIKSNSRGRNNAKFFDLK